MSTFVFRLTAPRPTFALDMTDEEPQAAIERPVCLHAVMAEGVAELARRRRQDGQR